LAKTAGIPKSQTPTVIKPVQGTHVRSSIQLRRVDGV